MQHLGGRVKNWRGTDATKKIEGGRGLKNRAVNRGKNA